MATDGYDYLCVLDFEATCDAGGRNPQPQEIIEFPVVLLNARTLVVEDVFHHYVRPEHHPQLTPFCTELTGITQAMVADGLRFPHCLELYRQWLVGHGLLSADGGGADRRWLSVSCGIWDHDYMMPTQCAASRIRLPEHFRQACDIKRVFVETTGRRAGSMPNMLATLGLALEGRHHSGIDDAKNIARIAAELIRRGAVFRPTWSHLVDGQHRKWGR